MSYDDPKTVEVECGKNCTRVPYCGDGIKNGTELCDYGAEDDASNPNAPLFNSDTKYNGCTTQCDFGPYCGDSFTDTPDETCDDGFDNVSWAAAEGACSYDCQDAPFCGDGIRNGPEQCDLGPGKNDGGYGTCNADCTFAPRCGDGVKQGTEQCDAGPTGSLTCSLTCKRREIVQ